MQHSQAGQTEEWEATRAAPHPDTARGLDLGLTLFFSTCKNACYQNKKPKKKREADY